VEKLHRETIRLSQIQDIAGCRLLVTDLEAQDRVVEEIVGLFPAAIVIDRRLQPSYGYRAVHVVVVSDRASIEVQIRTALQHLWAEMSEKVSDIEDKAIKYGGGPASTQELLARLSRLVPKSKSTISRFVESQRNRSKLVVVLRHTMTPVKFGSE